MTNFSMYIHVRKNSLRQEILILISISKIHLYNADDYQGEFMHFHTFVHLLNSIISHWDSKKKYLICLAECVLSLCCHHFIFYLSTPSLCTTLKFGANILSISKFHTIMISFTFNCDCLQYLWIFIIWQPKKVWFS